MPKYGWEDPETGEQWETDMKYEEMLQYKEQNPHLHQVFNINFTSSRYESGGKMDDGWKEMLGRIADQNPDSDMRDHGSRKSIKEIKTRNAIEKNRKRLGIKNTKIDTSVGIGKHGERTPD